MDIAKEILRQLGGNKFTVMTGSKNLTALKNGLQMSLARNKSGANALVITLNAMDTYDLEFFKQGVNRVTKEYERKLKAELKDIYSDQLQEIFTQKA